MGGNDNSYKGTFLSSGGSGYTAPSPRKPNIKKIVQHMQQCRNEMTHDMMLLQQAALEQERLENYYDQLAVGVKTLIEVAEELEAGMVIASEWVKHRDQAITIIRMILDKAQQNQSQEQK